MKGLLHLTPLWTLIPTPFLLLTLSPLWWKGELNQLTEQKRQITLQTKGRFWNGYTFVQMCAWDGGGVCGTKAKC